MRQFIVPQFITVEDKILGPITVRQFLILLVVVLIEFVTFKLADFTLFILLSIPIIIFGIVLGFVQINGKPFHFFLLNFLGTIKRSRIRIWSGNNKEIYNLDYEKKKEVEKIRSAKAYDASQVAELSKTVDTSGKYNR